MAKTKGEAAKCQECGAEFRVKHKNHRYCKLTCKSEAYNRRAKMAVEEFIERHGPELPTP